MALSVFPSLNTKASEPTGDEILEAFIKATGGKDAYSALHNQVSSGSMEMPAMGIKATMISYSEEPNKSYSKIESPAIGTIESGTDGSVYWEITMMSGPRILEGEERASSMRAATFNSTLLWKQLFKTAEYAGVDTLDGKLCNTVILTPNEGQPEKHYFDAESHLLVKIEATINTTMGAIKIENFPGDYREVNGVLMSYTSRQVLMGMQEMIFKSDKIEFNVDIPDSIFIVPDDITALMEK
ncbi:MAG: hypothetical protein KJ970_07745 [Candidatus Eisenbacteria bacterium]|uniref:Outer membrane lipoprotein-sorting protein n=1 Tax=Eiseniibacteriota bacterium TaxID=2212470 RepID=A0A948RWF8_UNCEI|nr:hypothetical protein [Candidatus Eisenbacteria bacterium]